MGDRHGSLSVGDEARETGDDAGVGLVTNLGQGLGEGLPDAAEQNLASLHERTRTTGIPIDVRTNIGVPHNREQERHLRSRKSEAGNLKPEI